MSRNRLGYVRPLDGIRGVAILAVVLYHGFGRPSGGFLGVDLFFVLSGFLITTLLLEEYAQTGRVSLRDFYVRRARRLLPALVGMLSVFLVLIAAAGDPGLLERGLKLVAVGGLYISNFARAFWRPDPVFGSPFGHLWSLAEEEQFYVVWPMLLLLTLRRGGSKWMLRLAAAMVVLGVLDRLALAAAGASSARIKYGLDSHADGLLLGCLLAILLQTRPIRAPRWGGEIALGVFAAVALTAHEPSVSAQVWGLPLVEAAAALLILSAVSAPHAPVSRLLASQPLVSLGRISYGLYVWHQFVRWICGFHYPLVALPLSLAIAIVSYKYLELPLRRRRTRASHELPKPQTA